VFITTKVLGLLLTPPGIIIIVGGVGLLLWRRRPGASAALIGLSTLLLAVLSLPVIGQYLMSTLERDFPPLAPSDNSWRGQIGAIVVLGGGRHEHAPEYGGETVQPHTLERLRYATQLQRSSGSPILVSGGSPFGEPVSEAQLMQQALADFRLRAAWLENHSRNTQENAVHSQVILKAAGVRRVLLVTHAWHMPRAVWAFRNTGVDVIPAPLGYQGHGKRTSVQAFLPSAHGLWLSSRALQERLGLLWYRLRYGAAVAPRPVATTGISPMQAH
jgi:uncharacterized SAM-binding protein YcdF (DUF218 family)